MLIGKVIKNSKERLMVTVTEQKGAKVIDLRVYNIINDGELVPTADGLVLPPEKVEPVIELLKQAQKTILAS
ncbi:MAG TPA: PC4/YdbC family ssDNA-binding protein [Syntrophorhabdaceae bacterium]|nr:PC4/YdbC family ssDNA-binding protein [Syntrophorhabdaceae bacterium]